MSRSTHARRTIFVEVDAERGRQDAKFGPQSWPNGTGRIGDRIRADAARAGCDVAAMRGDVTWRHIFYEEVREALAETDPAKIRAELIQALAVAVHWIEDIDAKAEERAEYEAEAAAAASQSDAEQEAYEEFANSDFGEPW